ncbi:MAG: response regulator transcription factor [Acidobacteria bacterium]|nr:response regulator transcription factor [Acidobacteriota bacterium]
MAKQQKIRILIGDRRTVFRLGLEQLLSREPDLSVVGHAEGARQTLKMVSELKPTVLLLGPLSTEITEMEVLQKLHRRGSHSRVILLRSLDKEGDLEKAAHLGIAGILSKEVTFLHLADCIRKVCAGHVFLDAQLVAARQQTAAAVIPDPIPGVASPLSLRERQVVELVSQGFRNKEIAQRMFISEQTVKNHLHNIFDKVGVSDRLELALYAIHKSTEPRQ